jgi:hypothetical protein
MNPRPNCSQSNVSPVYRHRSGGFGEPLHGLSRAIAAVAAGVLLMGSASFAAEGGTAQSRAILAAPADTQTEALLHSIEQQIASGRIISPPDDNAMDTWQRVLQREIASQASPEVLRALADFEARLRVRSADERAAGRALVAAELTVFADQAGRMVGHIPPSASSGTAASATGAPAHDGPQVQSASTEKPAPTAATRDPPRPPSASATVGAADAVTSDASHTRSSSTAGPAPDAVTLPPSTSAPVGAVVPASNAVIPSQPASASTAGPAPDAETRPPSTGASAGTVVTASNAVIPPKPVSAGAPAGDAATRRAAKAGSSRSAPVVATHDTVPVDRLASPLRSPPPPVPAAAGSRGVEVVTASSQTLPAGRASQDAPPAASGADPDPTAAPATAAAGVPEPVVATAPATSPPKRREPSVAEFYASRGDELMRIKDISAARKFYEFAANAGSAHAAIALARTYDAAFVFQLGVVGVKPDPDLAAAWYRRAEELGGPRAEARVLTQGGETGK